MEDEKTDKLIKTLKQMVEIYKKEIEIYKSTLPFNSNKQMMNRATIVINSNIKPIDI